MGIDFFRVSDKARSNQLFSLNEKTLGKIKPAIDALEAKSGIFIDPYGKTVLYPNHLQIILQNMKAGMGKHAKDPDVVELKNFIEARLDDPDCGALALEGD